MLKQKEIWLSFYNISLIIFERYTFYIFQILSNLCDLPGQNFGPVILFVELKVPVELYLIKQDEFEGTNTKNWQRSVFWHCCWQDWAEVTGKL